MDTNTTTARTTASRGRSFKKIAWTEPMPMCQGPMVTGGMHCYEPGEFDAPTIAHGSWANLCTAHAEALVPAGSSVGFHRVPGHGA